MPAQRMSVREFTNQHKAAMAEAARERWARERQERADAIKADIAAGTFARRIDRLVNDDRGELRNVYRILEVEPDAG